VSKNGNLLLSIPLRGDGTPDEKELKILEDIRAWFAINGDAIYGTRPWRVFGEGPSLEDRTPEIEKGGIPLFRREPYVAEDIRFTTKGDALHAISLAWPESGRLRIKSLATGAPGVPTDIAEVRLLGSPEALQFKRTNECLEISLPANKPGEIAYAFKITGRR
jgi:alpha-L-fucosidase